jgi:hypothetical protein
MRPCSHDSRRQPQTYVKPETAITAFELLMMSGVSLETCWAIEKHWNNKLVVMAEPWQLSATTNVCKTRGCNYSFWAPDDERCVARNMLGN